MDYNEEGRREKKYDDYEKKGEIYNTIETNLKRKIVNQ